MLSASLRIQIFFEKGSLETKNKKRGREEKRRRDERRREGEAGKGWVHGFVLSRTISSVYSHFFVHGPFAIAFRQ
jgi:hypothetical protein